MRHVAFSTLVLFAAFVTLTGTAFGDIIIDVPFFSLRIGPRWRVQPPVPAPPAVEVQGSQAEPAPPRAIAPAEENAGEPLVVPPAPPQVLPPPRIEGSPAVPGSARPPTHAEFGKSFEPREGLYEVVLTHPHSGQPVLVRFQLPPGHPNKVRIERNELEFDYGKFEVEIRFHKDGKVSVEYNR